MELYACRTCSQDCFSGHVFLPFSLETGQGPRFDRVFDAYLPHEQLEEHTYTNTDTRCHIQHSRWTLRALATPARCRRAREGEGDPQSQQRQGGQEHQLLARPPPKRSVLLGVE